MSVKVNCLNPIAKCGLDLLDDNYEMVDDAAQAEAILVRSASMHEMDLPENLLEYRQDFDKQDHDHGGHHHQHQQRIGDCTADRFGNFQFLFIVAGKAF